MGSIDWRGCNQDLPDDDIEVLGYDDLTGHHFLVHRGDGTWRDEDDRVISISHWRDLDLPGDARSADKILREQFRRRVPVEEYLMQASKGQQPLPSAAKCRELAIAIGVPADVRAQLEGVRHG